MEITQLEQKIGYSVWQNDANEQYLVVEGLDPTQVHTPGMVESFLIEHYTIFAVLYWLLLVVIFMYLITHYIIKPLLTRHNQGLPLFTDD